MPNTEPKVALITGANKGIGLEVARQLAQSGCTVIVGARDLIKGAEAAAQLTAEGLSADTIALDLNEQATIKLAAETITRKYGRLDILVNNAGIADPADGPPSQSSPEAIERTLQTNFLGAILVTQAMLPLLRQAPAARIGQRLERPRLARHRRRPRLPLRRLQIHRLCRIEGRAEHVHRAPRLRAPRHGHQGSTPPTPATPPPT